MIEIQPVDGDATPFVPIARIRFEEEIQIDQEALHFDPVAGRGFEPHGFFTEVRKVVYPVSAHSRPASAPERVRREQENRLTRAGRFLEEREGITREGALPGTRRLRAWLKFLGALARTCLHRLCHIHGGAPHQRSSGRGSHESRLGI